MKPGIYYNVSFEDYQAIQAINCSRLVAFSKTPAHALIKKPDTAGMRLGRAVHAGVNEPTRYAREWGFMPKGMRKKGPQFEAWLKDNPGVKEFCHVQDEEAIKGIVASISSGFYETARKYLELWDSTEVTLVWQHPKYGCLCKARPDGISSALGSIGDLKSATTADPKKWLTTGLNAGLKPHWQCSWYLDGAREILDPGFREFKWVVCEVKEPFGISVIQATPVPEGNRDLVARAEIEIDEALGQYLRCEKQGRFPGRPDEVVYAEFPAWC